MKTITFTCETISPMFIGNANTKETEMRPPVIKAQLRFWWRALHGHLTNTAPPNNLKKHECEFFGGSYEREVNREKELIENPGTFSFLFLQISQPKIQENTKIEPRDNHRNVGRAKAFKNNNKFTISIKLKKEEYVKKILAIFHIASALGGLGKRTRRGAGAWKITKCDFTGFSDDCNYSFSYSLDNILKSINIIVPEKYEEKSNKIVLTDTPGIQYPYLKSIQSGHVYENEKALRERIMSAAHHCQKHIDNNNQYSSYLGGASRNNRLASPIYVSIIPDEENKVKPIISELYCGVDNSGLVLQKEFTGLILNVEDITCGYH